MNGSDDTGRWRAALAFALVVTAGQAVHFVAPFYTRALPAWPLTTAPFMMPYTMFSRPTPVSASVVVRSTADDEWHPLAEDLPWVMPPGELEANVALWFVSRPGERRAILERACRDLYTTQDARIVARTREWNGGEAEVVVLCSDGEVIR